jgi:TonB-dependent Receptor Plug Domain.
VDIRIRGGNSLTSGSQPLYVIDGYPVTAGSSAGGSGAGQNPLATLNPGDIESMEILRMHQLLPYTVHVVRMESFLFQPKEGNPEKPRCHMMDMLDSRKWLRNWI